MGAVKVVAAFMLLVGGAPAHADAVTRWQPQIVEASARFGIPALWIERVMRAESAGLTLIAGRPIRSSAGAMGLMQLMPATWATMRQRLGLGLNPDDPRDNILAGACYLRLMHDRFGYPGLLAAYNLGPTGYAQYLAGKRTLPAETMNYLVKLTGAAPAIATAPVNAPPPLFAVRRDASQAQWMPQPGVLFAVMNDAR